MTTNLPSFLGSQFAPESGLERFGDWIGVSDSLTELFDRLRQVIRTRDPLIIEGESGVGKRSLLLQVHGESALPERPLVVVNCATLPAKRAEAELFGSGGTAGALQRATGGDLLLAELPLLPLPVQRLLAERFAGASILPRLLATSHSSLADECERGRFDGALFALVSTHRHALLPLRERREDILPLAELFLMRSRTHASSFSTEDLKLGANEVEALVNHDWPGNARELKSVIERSIRRGNAVLGASPVWLGPTEQAPLEHGGFEPGSSYRETRARFEADFEVQYVRWLLGRHSGNISAASREARMDRKYLYDLARKHGLRGQRQIA